MDKTWKRNERLIAKFFNTQRTPLSGGSSRHTRSDTLHSALYVETKTRKNHSVVNLWNETARLATKEGKLPIIALKQHRRRGFWLVIKDSDLLKLMEIMNESNS